MTNMWKEKNLKDLNLQYLVIPTRTAAKNSFNGGICYAAQEF